MTLKGINSRQAIIDGNGKGTVVTIPGTNPVLIEHLTVTRGFGDGGGISVTDGASLNVRHTVIVNNYSTTSGGGIEVNSNRPVTIFDCAVGNNQAVLAGGGVFLVGESTTVVISNSVVSRNSVPTGVGGGIAIEHDASQISVLNSSIVENSAADGGGLWVVSFPVNWLTVTDSTFTGNSASDTAGGLYMQGADTAITHSIFDHNRAAKTGGGILAAAGFRGVGSTALKDVYAIQNTAGTSGGGIWTDRALTTTHTVIADNLPDNCAPSGCPK